MKNGLIPVEEQPAAAEAGPSSSTMQPSSSNNRQALGLSQQLLDSLKAGKEKSIEHLGLFFFNNSVPLHIIEDKNLKAAFAILGVGLPTRWDFESFYRRRKQACINYCKHIACRATGRQC